MAGNVANRGVESKLDPEVMQVVDDRHHAVWEKSCEWHEFLYIYYIKNEGMWEGGRREELERKEHARARARDREG